LAALNALRAEPELATRVRDSAMDLSMRLKAAGLTVSTPDAAVVSVHAPSPGEAIAWAARCAEQGIRVGCFRPPSVPDGISRLRLTARADFTESDVERAVKVIIESAPPGATS
jgi:8-amino-7-oxononanoate synthase